MAIDKQKLLHLIAARPKIRTVEIADLIDCEPEQVKPALQSYIDAGDIILHPVRAPNGLQVPGFEFSQEFMKRDIYKVLITPLATEPDIRVAVAPVKQIEEKLGTTALRGKADIAIECLELHAGKVDNDQMCAALSLPRHSSPAPWLKTTMNKGIIWKDKKFFYLSSLHPQPKVDVPEFPEPKAKPSAKASRSLPANLVSELSAAGKRELTGVDIDAAHSAPQVQPIAEPKPDFRCALWSNGDIEMRRGPESLAVLSLAEWKLMREFVGKVELA